LQAPVGSSEVELIHAIDAALEPRRPTPGFVVRPSESVKPVVLPPWYIDRCRQTYLSVSFEDTTRVIGVTSAQHGEGKTSVAIGMATAIAADTREPTLLLECDLERPAFCRVLGLSTEGGLAEWLAGHDSLRVVRMPYLPHMVVLPAGAPHRDPARLLYRMSESNTIADLKMRFRNIVLDLPPVLTTPYSALAARLPDRLLVVARYGVTPTQDLEQVVFLLGRERVSGVVLNATDYRTPSWLRRLL
jgi:Mrp family chromosome partitioning ATPase